jgi:GR25 family glycosyltransferase involved in LPS biosynthesis
MSPCPVCIILEDDAILVDRFIDRLHEILEELPRDFHFCSIGYSRPRTAPLVKFSRHLVIPTCIFYLTGYILSLDGAKHLLDSMPVSGPIDTWIGLKMCQNWDNLYGSIVGVGVQSNPIVEAPSRKDLTTIMRFRAFGATLPLCAQNVSVGGGIASAAGSSETNWRQRDTDITYSGSANYVG